MHKIMTLLTMKFCEIIGCSSTTHEEGSSFFKSYKNLNDYHWTRIKNVSTILSNEKIGPKIKSIDEDSYSIVYEKVTPLERFDDSPKPNLSKEETHRKVCNLIGKLHGLGYGHGDLQLNNIGFINENLYILDHDSIYVIKEGEVEWLSKWMKEGFDWNGTFDEFVESDYDNWNTDWLFIY
jgi:hypothetical protein